MYHIQWSFLLIILIHQTCSEKIFIYIPLPFYSHQAVYRPLWKELANRGHQITLLTPNPMENHENITQVDLSSVYKFLEERHFYDLMTSGDQSLGNVWKFFNLIIEAMDIELREPEMRHFIEGKGQFDLVITELLSPVGVQFAYKYGCPFIGVVPMDANPFLHGTIGNPVHPVLYPSLDSGLFGQLSFKERILSTIFDLIWIPFTSHLNSMGNSVIKDHFGDVPLLQQLIKKFSLVFTNANPIFNPVRPLNPQTINVGGGFHIEKAKALPADIQTFLDNSPGGVIYFSLGTSVKSSHLSPMIQRVIMETFSQMSYEVLWKCEKLHNNSAIPKNVHTWEWLPQQDVLRHPNIKLFITQGGLQSLEEALFIGVPVLVLPFFGDQMANANRVVENGLGLTLDPRNLTSSSFAASILEITSNKRFKQRTLELARQLTDTPMGGVEKAVWWTEYVLRHKNVDILKHPHGNIPFYQYYFLDVGLFFLCLIIALFFIVLVNFKLVFYFYIFFFRSSSMKNKKE